MSEDELQSLRDSVTSLKEWKIRVDVYRQVIIALLTTLGLASAGGLFAIYSGVDNSVERVIADDKDDVISEAITRHLNQKLVNTKNKKYSDEMVALVRSARSHELEIIAWYNEINAHANGSEWLGVPKDIQRLEQELATLSQRIEVVETLSAYSTSFHFIATGDNPDKPGGVGIVHLQDDKGELRFKIEEKHPAAPRLFCALTGAQLGTVGAANSYCRIDLLDDKWFLGAKKHKNIVCNVICLASSSVE